jgi:RNA polymerase sigma factor (sigma-70 family)
MMDDETLLREYVERRSERAFAELVGRYLPLVLGAAARVVGERQAAQDVAQGVFIQLARKAWMVRTGGALPGWLYRTACRQAINASRGEQRRRQREAVAMSTAEQSTAPAGGEQPMAWEQVGPLLDEAMAELPRVEQDAVVLRFFQGKSLRETGEALAMSEEAARKRVSRALDKLREYFTRRGVTASAVILAEAIHANAAPVVGAGLAASGTEAALAGAGSGLALGTVARIIFMTTKMKTMLVTAAVVAVLASIPMEWQYRANARLKQEAATAEAQAATAARTQTQLRARVAELEAQARAASGSAAAVTPGNGTVTSSETHFLKADETAALMQNPAMHSAMAAQMRTHVQSQIGDLMKHYGLTAAESDTFANLFVDEQMKLSDLGLKSMQPGVPAEDREALAQQMQAAKSALDAQVREFLNNDDDYAYYQTYTAQQEQHAQIQTLGASLAAAGQPPLSAEQSDALLSLIVEESQNANLQQSVSDPTQMSLPGDLAGAAGEKYLAAEEQMQNHVAERAEGVLTPPQLEVLKQDQANQLELLKAVVKTVGQTSSNGNGTVTP